MRCAFFLFPLFFLPATSGAQTPFDDLAESDLRVEELKQKLIDSSPIPDEFRLRYGGKRNDYVRFYDRVNAEIYFRYREDRFDRRAEKKIAHLIEGQPYRVKGRFLGVMLSGRFYPDVDPDFTSSLKNPDSIPVFEFESAAPLKIEQILIGAGKEFYHPAFRFVFVLPVASRIAVFIYNGRPIAEIESYRDESFLIHLSSYSAATEKRITRVRNRFLSLCDALPDFPKREQFAVASSCDITLHHNRLTREFRFYKSQGELYLFQVTYRKEIESEIRSMLDTLQFI